MVPTMTQAWEPKAELTPSCLLVADALLRLGEKWSILVVCNLRVGTQRFTVLKRNIPGISQRMLTLALRGLERDGIVRRTVHATVPPRVDYELTPLGQSLVAPIDALGAWALSHQEEINAARRAFDVREETQ